MNALALWWVSHLSLVSSLFTLHTETELIRQCTTTHWVKRQLSICVNLSILTVSEPGEFFTCWRKWSASLFGCVSNWWIIFGTAFLRMWSCSWTAEWNNPWILNAISPRQLSLYVPYVAPSQSLLCLLEWSKDVLASELLVSWRSQGKFGFSTVLCGAVGEWYVLLYNSSPDFLITTFSMHIAGKVLWRMIAFDRVW